MYRVLIVQSTKGKTFEEQLEAQGRAKRHLESDGYTVIATISEGGNWQYGEDTGVPVGRLAQAIEKLSKCDKIYLCNGWEKSRNCWIICQIAREYKIDMLFEDYPETPMQTCQPIDKIPI